MGAMIRRAVVLGCMGVLFLAPRASAITVDQVVALARSGVTDTVILALIDRDRTVFAIEPEQIVSLKRDLSEPVILAMLKSGRAEGDQAARADAAYNSSWIASNLATEPAMVTVGHGPDRPNTPHIDGFWSGPPAAAASFAVPYAAYTAPAFHYRAPAFGSHRSTDQKALCYAQVNSLRSTVQSPPFVTVCPDVMQPTLLRR
jgi:hypothetical protein